MVSQNNNQNNGKINDGRIEINGKVYQTVAYRLAAFRAKYPVEAGWRIKTKCLQREGEKIVFQAAIKNPEGQVVATGHAEEKRDASFINRTSAMENAETSAIGRALAAAGFIGSEFASADELALAIQAQKSSQARKAEAKPQPQAAETKPQPQPQADEAKPQQQPQAAEAKPQPKAAATPAIQLSASQAAQPVQPQPAPQPAKPTVQPAVKAAEPSQAKTASQARPAAPSQSATQPSEQMAEKWTRDNLAQWLDTPCQFAKAQGRTWRQLAENKGDKIEIKGKPCQPRAFLHAL